MNTYQPIIFCLNISLAGFRRFHSTMSTLLDCTNEWYVNMDRGFYNLVIFLDLKKAFDTVDHGLLLAKLKLYGIGDTAFNLFCCPLK